MTVLVLAKKNLKSAAGNNNNRLTVINSKKYKTYYTNKGLVPIKSIQELGSIMESIISRV
jgi:hypothetical protein